MRFNSWFIIHACVAAALLSSHEVDGAIRKTAETEKKTIGLALPGGSFTAATTGASIMRGFQQQKVMIDGEMKPALDMFDYVAGLSGGNVPHLQFAYAQGLTSNELLDADGINDPTNITAAELDTISEKSMFKTYATSTAMNVVNSLFAAAVFKKLFWPTMVSLQLLKPLGILEDTPIGTPRSGVKYTPVIETCMVGPKEFGLDWLYKGMLVEFFEKHEKLKSSLTETFQVGNYTLIQLDHDILWKHAEETGFQIPIPAFITPDTFNIPFLASELRFDSVGNKTAANVSFSPISMDPNNLQPESEGAFTLQKWLSLGTNSGQIMASTFPDEFPLGVVKNIAGAPLILDIPTADGDTRSMAFTDGGSVDGSGIPSLIKLNTKKIIFPLMATGSRASVIAYNPVNVALNSLKSHFGAVTPEEFPFVFGPMDMTLPFVFHFWRGNTFEAYVFNVMSNGVNQLAKFYDDAMALHEAGEPIIVTLENLEVVENRFWGIEGGGRVDLTIIVILDVPKKFSDQVDQSVAPSSTGGNFTENGFFTNEDLYFVPNLISSGERPDVVIPIDIDLLNYTGNITLPGKLELSVNPRGCKMTYIMLSWMIKESWEGLEDANGTTVFGGFKSIFNDDDQSNSGSTMKNFSMLFISMSSIALILVL